MLVIDSIIVNMLHHVIRPKKKCWIMLCELLVGVSTRFGFPVFGQNREPEPGYPGSLFWETGTGT
jgi:hypothetical protein